MPHLLGGLGGIFFGTIYLYLTVCCLMCQAAVTHGNPPASLKPDPALLSLPRISSTHHTQQLFNKTNNNVWKMSQYTINDSSHCLTTTNSFDKVWNSCTFADDRSQLLTWLSPLEPSLRHFDIRDRRVNDIGEWLMQTEEFKRW